ncbi:MAG: glycosyltransferase family 4 protein [Spirochaetia bacterium]|nr:glycosyltransferase family 4 protein [Spirochaetia bacterium]
METCLLELLAAVVEKLPLPRGAAEYLSFFGIESVYDSYFIEASKRDASLKSWAVQHIPTSAEKNNDEAALRSWGRFLLAMDRDKELLCKVAAFCRIPSSDSVLNSYHKMLLRRMADEDCTVCGPKFKNKGEPSFQIVESQIPFLRERGIVLFQFLFHGDPARSGTGDSGGMATLVGDLGNMLGRQSNMAGVVTVVLYDTAYPAEAADTFIPLSFPEDRHAILRIPVWVNGSTPERYSEAETLIEYRLFYLIEDLGLLDREDPVVFHVRYIDAASFAAAKLAERLKIPLVSTLTPDPHRSIDEQTPQNSPEDAAALPAGVQDFHRIIIGDRLCDMSKGIVGIGRSSIATTLIPYFPKLRNKENTVIEGIDEGIRIGVNHSRIDLEEFMADSSYRFHIDARFSHQPVILNIGRLHSAKGQYTLLQAWDLCALWKVFNLIVVGGNFQHPTEVEGEIIEGFYEYLRARPYLHGRVLFRSSLPNQEVRKLQETLAKGSTSNYPHIYLCSSKKEEFGLSIVEAMSAGMLTMAPLKGGAQEYLHHGINGFLLDTGDPKSIGRDVCAYICKSGLQSPQWRAMQKNAAATIRRMYALENIAQKFADFYARVVERE